MPARIAWRMYDPLVPEEYLLQVNPNEGGLKPDRKKTVTYSSTAAAEGKTLIFEGRDDPGQITFSGVLLTKEQYDTFQRWYEKRHQIRVTDHLGQVEWLYITSLTFKHQRARNFPWKHTWAITAIPLDWES